MHGAMAFFTFVFIMCQIIVIAISGGGMAVTRLDAVIDEDDVVLSVETTANFLNATPGVPAYLLLTGSAKEIVSYTGSTDTTFTGLTRAVVVPEYTLPGGRSRWFRYLFK